jgi:Lrp/AsnC family transcriptional regulator for asnA, asnC and gidA
MQRIVAICQINSLAEVAAVTNAVIALDRIRDVDSELVLQTIKYDVTIGPIATIDDLARWLALGR